MKKYLLLFITFTLLGCTSVSERDLQELDDFGGASFTGEFSMVKLDELYEKIELISMYPEKATDEDFVEVELGLKNYLNYVRAYRKEIGNYEINIEDIQRRKRSKN